MSKKKYSEMNAQELAEATREFDAEMPGVPGKPLTAAQKKMHRDAAAQARVKRIGRPVKGEGSEVVAASIERGLLKKAYAYGKAHKMGRSQLFAAALRALLDLPPEGSDDSTSIAPGLPRVKRSGTEHPAGKTFKGTIAFPRAKARRREPEGVE